MHREDYLFHVYILASRSRNLYIGMTNDLRIRMKQHKQHRAGTYTARYKIDRLLYSEHSNTSSTRLPAKRISTPGPAPARSS